jgi:hypothetical protein
MTANHVDLSHKAVVDSFLLEIPGVVAADMSGLAAYFINKRMFACISNGGVGLRLSYTAANELRFSRGDVESFQPKGLSVTREWIQINHATSEDYRKDLEIFLASIEFVRAARQ